MYPRRFFLLNDELEQGFTPAVEAFQNDGRCVLRAELPGVEPSTVEIDVADGVLTLRGERRREARDEGATWYRREARYGAFERRFELPDGTSPENIRATWRHGVLEITFPDPAAARRQPVRIPVETAAETNTAAAA